MEAHNVFNILDYVVIGVVLLSGLAALLRGLVREVVSLVVWGGAILTGVKYYPLAVPMMKRYFENPKTVEVAAGATVFVGALIIFMIIGFIICSFIKGRALTAIDRSLGFIFGVARGYAAVSIIYLVLTVFLWPNIDSYQPPKPEAPAQEVPATGTAATGEAPKPEAAQEKKDDHFAPPAMLMEAKTRPAMAFGADMAKQILPKAWIDKMLANVDNKKEELHEKAQSEIDREVQQKKQEILNKLSTPAPPGEGGGKPIDQGTKP